MQIRALIVDDEAPARRRIRKLLSIDAGVDVVGECATGEDAVLAVERETPDLIFLDIRLPDMDGFDVLDRIGDAPRPLVVFVTAFDEHAVKAFGVPALDYLVKPFERERLYTAVTRARTVLGQSSAPRDSAAPVPSPGAAVRAPGGRVAIRTDGRVQRVRLDEIERVEADRDWSTFHLRGGTSLVAREGLSGVERRLPPSMFMRVHRSHIVNVARVREVHPWFQGESVLVLEDGSKVVTGRTYRDRIQTLMR